MSKDSMSDHKVENYLMNAKLCKLVEMHPCMYDRSSPNYLKKECVESAWNDISQQMKDTVVSCRERWRNIRTAYARSVNIYKSPSGPNRHKQYYLHDELQFLTKHLTQGLPSLRVLTPSELDANHENFRQSTDQSDDNGLYEIITLDSPTPLDQEETSEEDHDRVSKPDSDPEPKDINLPAPDKTRCRKLSDDLPIASKIPKRDLDLEFVNIILPEIKNMNSRQKVLFKGKIFEALEEVLSDTKDFPQKDQPLKFCDGLLNPRADKNGVQQRELRSPQNGEVPLPIKIRSGRFQNESVKQENRSEKEYD